MTTASTTADISWADQLYEDPAAAPPINVPSSVKPVVLTDEQRAQMEKKVQIQALAGCNPRSGLICVDTAPEGLADPISARITCGHSSGSTSLASTLPRMPANADQLHLVEKPPVVPGMRAVSTL